MYVEYLVNFAYLNRVMENYGFRLLTLEEAQAIGLPNSSGSFSDLYNTMIEEIKIDKYKQNDYGDAAKMSAYEKTISFLNKYVVYKKISKITDVASVALELLEETVLEPAVYRPQKKTTKKGVVVPAKKRIDLKLPKAVNLHKTIRLLEDVEIEEIEEIVEDREKESVEEIVINIPEPVIKEVIKEKKTRKPYTKKGALKIAEEEIAPPIAAPIAEIDELVSKPKSTKKVAKPRAKKEVKEMIVEVEIPVKEVIKPVKVAKTKKVKPVVAFEVEEEGEGEGEEKEVIKEKKPKKAVKPRAKKDKEDK